MTALEFRLTGPNSDPVNEVLNLIDRLLSSGSFETSIASLPPYLVAGTFEHWMKNGVPQEAKVQRGTRRIGRGRHISHGEAIIEMLDESVQAGSLAQLNSSPEMQEDCYELLYRLQNAIQRSELSSVLTHFCGKHCLPNIAQDLSSIWISVIQSRLIPKSYASVFESVFALTCQGLVPVSIDGTWPVDFRWHVARFFPEVGITLAEFAEYLSAQPVPTMEDEISRLPDEAWQDMEIMLMEADPELLPHIVPRLNTQQLHEFVMNFNWGDDPDPIDAVLEQTACDKGTVRAVYWLCEPSAWAGKQESDVSKYSLRDFRTFKRAEELLMTDQFANDQIEFNPRRELGGIDSYWEGIKANSDIPTSFWS